MSVITICLRIGFLCAITEMACSFGSEADTVEKISTHPASGMTRADIYVWRSVQQPVAALLLCPGCNGNGEVLLHNKAWQHFAEQYNLMLFALSFASNEADLHNGTGYYYASKGSGQIVLDAIKKHSGKELPLLIYGFSGGAHFAARFAEWKPEEVISWCAYSAGWWDNPNKASVSPPGIVACGEDDPRLGASLSYFKQGRSVGKPWLWLQVPNNAHSPSLQVESFVRDYFANVLQQDAKTIANGTWLDIDSKTTVSEQFRIENPSITAWLPDAKLLNPWRAIHKP